MKKYIVLIALILTLGMALAEDLRLDVIWSNDVHGGIDRSQATFMNPEFPPQLGGGASAATLIKEIRSWHSPMRESLLLDAGDFFQGRPVGTVTKGKSVIEFMNLIGYDAMTLGNHEFDIMQDELIPTLELAEFPIISCNVVDAETEELLPYITPYIILNKMGLKIGILGMTTTDTELMSFPENIKGIKFVNEKEALTRYVKILREEEKVDLVIVLGHAGLPYDPEIGYLSRYDAKGNPRYPTRTAHWGYDAQELAREVEGIDLFIGGHIHKGFPEPWIDPVTHTIVIQGYAYGSNLGIITLKIDAETKTVSGWETPAIREGAMVTLFEDQFFPDPESSELIEQYVSIAEEGMDEIVGYAGSHLSRTNVDAQSPMGNMIVDAMRYMVDADFSFLNLGGVRAEIKNGAVTYRDVFEVMPFDNLLITFQCDGRLLKRIIETRVEGSRAGLIVSGVNVVYSRKRENFDRVTSLMVGGEPWDPDKIYTVATTDFLMQGNAGLTLLMNVPQEDINNQQINLRDAIVHYFKNNSPVTSKIDNRWKRDDNSDKARWMKE